MLSSKAYPFRTDLSTRARLHAASTYFFSRRTGMGHGFIHFEDDCESVAGAFPQTYYGERLEQVLYRLHIAKDRIGRRNARQSSRPTPQWHYISGGKKELEFAVEKPRGCPQPCPASNPTP